MSIQQFIDDCNTIYHMIWQKYQECSIGCVPEHLSFRDSKFLRLFSKVHQCICRNLRPCSRHFVHFITSNEFMGEVELFIDPPPDHDEMVYEKDMKGWIDLWVMELWTHNFQHLPFHISLYNQNIIWNYLFKHWTTFRIKNDNVKRTCDFYQFVCYMFPNGAISHKHKRNNELQWFVQTHYLPQLFDMFPCLANTNTTFQLKIDISKHLLSVLPIRDLVHICLEYLLCKEERRQKKKIETDEVFIT